jgi:hypothetical protein
MFGRKEAQTISHNLTFCHSLLLATCFAFWESRKNLHIFLIAEDGFSKSRNM